MGMRLERQDRQVKVSVSSARAMLEVIDRDQYELVMVGISREGIWLVAEDAQRLLEAGEVSEDGLGPVALDYMGTRELVGPAGDADRQSIDVIFPILHGPYGEDGTVQGLIELADVAYVGSGVLGSAVGLAKEMRKRVFRAEGVPQVEYRVLRRSRWERDRAGVLVDLEDQFEYPVFVKPVNLGSSVGVSKADDGQGLETAIAEAAHYAYKIVIEAAAAGCRQQGGAAATK